MSVAISCTPERLHAYVARHAPLRYSTHVGKQRETHILQISLFRNGAQVNPTVQNTSEIASHLSSCYKSRLNFLGWSRNSSPSSAPLLLTGPIPLQPVRSICFLDKIYLAPLLLTGPIPLQPRNALLVLPWWVWQCLPRRR